MTEKIDEIENILNYLETTSLEPHDDYISEFSYKDQKILWRYIKDLQQENEELKRNLEKKYEKVGTLTCELLYEENTKLINEISFLKIENQKLKETQCTFLGTGCQIKMKKYKEVIDKLKEEINECKLTGNDEDYIRLDVYEEILSKIEKE